MRWTYDPQADAIYMTVRDHVKVVAVSLAGTEVILDVDPVLGMVAGVEIIGAEGVFPRVRELLGEPQILGEGDERTV